MTSTLSALKLEFGGFPYASSIAVMPKDQMSAFILYGLFCSMTSGAIQSGEPVKVAALVSPKLFFEAVPKSPTFTPESERRTLAALMSRWILPSWCKYMRASNICRRTVATIFTSLIPFLYTESKMSRNEQICSGMTIQISSSVVSSAWFWCTNAQWALMTFLCDTDRIARISPLTLSQLFCLASKILIATLSPVGALDCNIALVILEASSAAEAELLPLTATSCCNALSLSSSNFSRLSL
mmetsp:Transcript_10232/g.18653  ORF Transcript_10232/g.18653 Transcript_10232/m.18653 type:complete len:241 (-) Transcript_10232:300-1022(-)